jgi:Mg-chelatase subunit ChlD
MSKQTNIDNGAGRATSITLLILDESGSMSSIAHTVVETHQRIISGILQEQEQHPELQQLVSVWTFEGNRIQERIPLQEAHARMRELAYQPLGNTPLYDAIGKAAGNLEEYLRNNKPEGPLRVSVAVLTDGYENASRSFTRDEIQRLVDRLRNSGWEFSYYGADHDVERIAMELHFNEHMQIDKSAHGMAHFAADYQSKELKRKLDLIKKQYPSE